MGGADLRQKGYSYSLREYRFLSGREVRLFGLSLIVALVLLMLFGRNSVSSILGELDGGIRDFRKTLEDTARHAASGASRFTVRRTIVLIVSCLAFTNSASAASPQDRGCCVFWQNPNRELAISSTEDTREQCTRDAKKTTEGADYWDFFVERGCKQAVRCRDVACTNLNNEPIEPLSGN